MTDAGAVSVAHQAGILGVADSAARRPNMHNSPANKQELLLALHCIALHRWAAAGITRSKLYTLKIADTWARTMHPQEYLPHHA